MRPSKAFAVITFLTLLSSFSTALSPTNASEDHSQHLTKLAAPNGVVTVPGSTSTVLRFTAVPNATSYKVRLYAVKGENPLRTIAPFNSGDSVSALTPNSTYKITVQAIANGVRYSNSEESRKVTVTTLSALAVPAFSLTPTVMTATAGQLFTSPTPVSTGGAIASFSIDAGIFPFNGLNFNTSTGVISGTPTTAWITNTYTITAHNSSGVASQSFTLITQAAPTVPALAGLTQAAAEASLIAKGFVLGGVTTTTSGATSGNNGLVKTQTPTAGSALAASSSVDLVLYLYIAPTVPVLAGLTQAAAEASLIANGFVLGGVTTTTSGATSGNNGLVQSQTPTAGSALAASGSVALVLYAYVAPTAPHISSISPTYGSTTGGTNVTIIGTGFQPGAIVYFGRQLLINVQVIDANTITGTTVGGYYDGSTWTVAYNSGVASNNDVNFFTYGPPSVSAISNASSTLAGGTTIVFTGGFNKCTFGPLNGTQSSSYSVTIGGVAASNILITGGTAGTGDTLTATTPAGTTAGLFDIQITLVGVGTVSLPAAFTYLAPTVPALAGLTRAAAEASLIAKGFVLGGVTTTTSGATSGNNGLVKTQTPTAGSALAASGSVALVLYAYVAPAAPVVTAGGTPSLGGTATATNTFTGGMWSLSATPAPGYTFTSWACSNGAFADSAVSAETTVTPSSDITCTATFSAVTLTSVWISTLPTKLLYAIGDPASAFEIAGLVVTRGFSDGSSVVFPGITLSNIDFTHWDSSTRVPYSLFPRPGIPLIITGLGMPVGFFVYFEAYVAPAAPVVTAASTPSLGGTATAADINLDGTWDLIATPAVGYTFTSWGCDASQIPASTSTATTTVTPSTNTTCIATFTAATTYTVTYHGNMSDTGSIPLDVNGPYIEAADVTVLDSSGLGRTGYTFAGWNTQADGRGAPTPQPGYPTFAMPAANVDLYAQWVSNTFNITWSDNGGAGTSGGDTTYIGGSQITGFPTMLPTYSGLKFIGWNTSSDGLGTDVSSGYMPQLTWPNSYSDITLYAKWANNTFNVTWDQNFNPNTQGHSASSGDSTYVGGSAVGMPGMPSNQDGYYFATWQASDTSTYATWGYVPIAPYGDITFTGVWTAIDISVNAIWDGGAMNPWISGGGGDTLVLTGSGFIAGTTVTIGGLNASITSLTDTSITVLTPIANDPGHMTVVVTSPNGSSASTTYFYQIT